VLIKELKTRGVVGAESKIRTVYENDQTMKFDRSGFAAT
jgi:hypothetical protein